MNIVKLLILMLTLFLYGDNPLVTTIVPIGDTTQIRQLVEGYIGTTDAIDVTSDKFIRGLKYLEDDPRLIVDTSDTKGKLELTITPRYVIRDITILHEFPLMEHDLRKALTIHSGSLFDSLTIKQQQLFFLEKMGEHGYRTELNSDTLSHDSSFNIAYVSIAVDTFDSLGVVDITFDVHKGAYYQVDKLAFEGNRKFGNFWDGLVFGGWRYRVGKSKVRKRYVSEDLPVDTKKLQNHYFKRDFAEAVVRDSVILDSVKNNAYIYILIDEGPRYKIKTPQVKPLTHAKVRQIVDLRDRGNREDYVLRRKIKKLTEVYKSRGYSDVRITLTDSLRTKRQYVQRRIYISVDTGSRKRIGAISFKGNDSFTYKKLSRVIQSSAGRKIKRSGNHSFVSEVFENDRKHLENFYYSQGFLGVLVTKHLVDTSKDSSVTLSFTIHEGVQTTLSQLSIIGVTDSTIGQKLESSLSLKRGDPFNPLHLKEDLFTIKEVLGNYGYNSSTLDYSTQFTSDSTSVEVKIYVELGQKKVVSHIIYQGNFKSKSDHLSKIVRIQEGDPLSLTRLYSGIRRLRDISVLTSVTYDVPALADSLYDTVTVQLTLEERKPFVFTGRVGFNTVDKFNTKLSLSNRNFLGKSKIVTLSGWYSSLEYGGDVSYFEPYFFYTDIRLTVRLYATLEELLDNKRVNTLALGNSYKLEYDIVKNRVVLSQVTTYEVRNMLKGSNYDDSDKAIDSAGIDRSLFDTYRQVLYYIPGLMLDLRDSYMHPKKGILNDISVTLSYGISLDDDKFVRGKEDFRFYIPVGRKLVIASRLGAGIVQGYGDSKTVASDQLLKIGGVQDVRGYPEYKLFPSDATKDAAPTFGYGTFNGSIEARVELLPFLELLTFGDVGTLTDQPNLSGIRAPRFSVGGGLLFISPIGPIGLLYGHRLYLPNDSYAKTKGHGRIHFSIGYTF